MLRKQYEKTLYFFSSDATATQLYANKDMAVQNKGSFFAEAADPITLRSLMKKRRRRFTNYSTKIYY